MAITYKQSQPTSSLEPGKLGVEVIDVEEKTSEAGNDMIVVTMVPVGQERPKFKEHLVLKENVLWKIDAFRKAIGEKIEPDVEVTIEPTDWLNKQLTIEIDKPDGEQYFSIVKFLEAEVEPF
jgi:hypothetical protein